MPAPPLPKGQSARREELVHQVGGEFAEDDLDVPAFLRRK